MGKHEDKQQEIVDAAFRIWGNEFFYRTSLSSLAEAMNITKPALYRYFKNKDALHESMREEFIFKYREILTISRTEKYADLDACIAGYNDLLVRFFAENYCYYRFFVLKLLVMNKNTQPLFEELKVEGENFLDPSLLKNFGFSENEAQSISGFVFSVGGFLLNQHLFTNSTFKNKEIDQMIRVINFICRFGLGGHNNISTDYEAVEATSTVGEDEVLPYNRIFTAVAEVIAEKGVWETTVDAVAEHLGMSKSSLYFYFKNKDQMIEDVVVREKGRISELIVERISRFSSFGEQIYCIFFVMSSYFLLKPSIFGIMNWLRFQHLDKPMCPENDKFEDFTGYIELISENTSFNPLGFSSDLIVKGLNFILIRELWECVINNVSKTEINKRLRNIHGLLLNGLKGN